MPLDGRLVALKITEKERERFSLETERSSPWPSSNHPGSCGTDSSNFTIKQVSIDSVQQIPCFHHDFLAGATKIRVVQFNSDMEQALPVCLRGFSPIACFQINSELRGA